MVSVIHNKQLLVVTFQFLESVFPEIQGVRMVSVKNHDSAFNLRGTVEKGEIYKRE